MGPELFVAMLACGIASGAVGALVVLKRRLRVYLLKLNDEMSELRKNTDTLTRELEEVKRKQSEPQP